MPYLYHLLIDYISSDILLSLFQLQCLSRFVANFSRTKILDRTRINIACRHSPFIAVSSKFLERSAVELNQSFLDNRFHFAVAFFHVHHHSYGDTTRDPLVSRSCRVAYGRHITSLAGGDQARSRITQRIAVVRIIVGWSSATAFVTEEVVLCSKLADIFAFGLPF